VSGKEHEGRAGWDLEGHKHGWISAASLGKDHAPFHSTSQVCPAFRHVGQQLQEPTFEKLLPDPVPDPTHPHPYTLVVDLDRFLVCHIWDREQSRWRIAKRPGVELFLFWAAQFYEIVVFSSLPQHEGDPLVSKLDPFGCIQHRLFRFATKHTR